MAVVVIVIIIALGIAGLLFQFYAWHSYRVEFGYLNRAIVTFRAMEGHDDRADEFISRSGLTEKSIVGHRIAQVRAIAKSPAPPSSADLSAADLERDDARTSSVVPNTLISILLIVGLAGTLFAFSEIFREIPTESKTTDEIKAWINTAYPAFGTAFQASLLGIGGTVLLLIMRSVVHNRRAELFDRLDRFTAADLYTRFVERQATDATTLTIAGQQLLQSSASFEGSVGKMEALPKAITTATGEIASATNAAQESLNAAQEVFREFREAFTAPGPIRKALKGIEQSVADFSNQSQATIGELRDAVSEAASVLSGTADSVKQASRAIAESSGKVAQCIAEMRAANAEHAAKLDSLGTALGGIVDGVCRSQREWNEAIAPAIGEIPKAAKAIEEGMSNLNSRTDALVSAVGLIEGFTSRLATIGDEQAKRFDAAAGKIEQALQQSSASQEQFIEKFTAQSKMNAETQFKQMEGIANGLGRSASEIVSSQREFLKNLEPILQQIPAQILSFAEQQAAMLARLRDVGGRIAEAKPEAGIRIPTAKRSLLGKLAFWRR